MHVGLGLAQRELIVLACDVAQPVGPVVGTGGEQKPNMKLEPNAEVVIEEFAKVGRPTCCS